MSENTPIDALDPRHDEDVALIVRYLGGTLSPTETARVARRLETDRTFAQVAAPLIESWQAPPPSDASLATGLADIRRRVALRKVAALTAEEVADVDGAGWGGGTVPSRRSARGGWKWWHPVAAALLLWLFRGEMSSLVHGTARADMRRFATRVAAAYGMGRRGDVSVLPDGTRVIAAAGARLDAAGFTITHRLVRLAGGATFEVARGRQSAFAVQTANALVTAAGTVFIVHTDTTAGTPRTTVDLREGTVALRALAMAGSELVLHSGQRARVVGGLAPEILTAGVRD